MVSGRCSDCGAPLTASTRTPGRLNRTYDGEANVYCDNAACHFHTNPHPTTRHLNQGPPVFVRPHSSRSDALIPLT